ncbi:TPA: hypothetical protein J8116_001271 [Escherichia coli]|nr:hypothetical protein [Escherichia coli]HAN3978660.1 hypothetical protein [Escherichia coli]HBA3861024.1 hypothetical protein [Escherichia coli]HBA5250048.1 hypothetical protein [Escherichia coli]
MLNVFPAPAGINRTASPGSAGGNGVPRASGDKPRPTPSDSKDTGCSPRQRG